MFLATESTWTLCRLCFVSTVFFGPDVEFGGNDSSWLKIVFKGLGSVSFVPFVVIYSG